MLIEMPKLQRVVATLAAVGALAGLPDQLTGGALAQTASIPAHHYNPGSRTVHSTYTCMDGSRSITFQYGQADSGRVTSLSRNGNLASASTVAKVNEILEYLDFAAALQPQCGSSDDTIIVTGRKRGAHAGILVRWSLTEAVMGQILE